MKNPSIKDKQYWKQKIKSQIQHRNFKKQIFGDHYNLSAIRINNGKKYFNEEIKIMQIERTNRLLLQKIKRISQRSKPRNILQRARTEAVCDDTEIQKSFTQHKIIRNKQVTAKRQRYQSVQTILQKTRIKTNQSLSKKKLKQALASQIGKNILFKGKKQILKIPFSFTIYIENGIYIIQSKTKISQQRIQISATNYDHLLKTQLDNNHLNIFNFFKVGENNKLILQFQQTTNIEVDTLQKTQFQLPPINSKNAELAKS